MNNPEIIKQKGNGAALSPDKKINILFMTDTFYGVGGTEKQLLELIQRLDKTKFTCYICPFYFSEEMLHRVSKLGVVTWPSPIQRIYGWSGVHQAFSIISKIRQYKIEIVSTFHFAADTYGVLISKLAGVPCIISNRRDTGCHRHNKYAFLIKMLDPLVSQYFAVCHAVADHINKDYKVEQNKIRTIYNGIDIDKTQKVQTRKLDELRKRYKIKDDTFVIGNISHLRPEKGYDIFFEAIRLVKPQIPNLKVFAVGSVLPTEKEFVNRLKQFAKDKGIDENLVITGYVDNATDFVHMMDIACLTAVSNEGFSNALLEEMTLGKAIIATDVGGNKEAIVDGESGIIIPPRDPEALASSILKLYHQPALRKRMGKAAVKRVKACFLIDKTISELEDHYLSLYNQCTNHN